MLSFCNFAFASLKFLNEKSYNSSKLRLYFMYIEYFCFLQLNCLCYMMFREYICLFLIKRAENWARSLYMACTPQVLFIWYMKMAMTMFNIRAHNLSRVISPTLLGCQIGSKLYKRFMTTKVLNYNQQTNGIFYIITKLFSKFLYFSQTKLELLFKYNIPFD